MLFKNEKRCAKLIAAVLVMSSLVGCGGEKVSNTSNTEQKKVETAEKQETVDQKEVIEFNFLSCWNGGGGGFPEDQINNPVAEYIRENFGIQVNYESITTNEKEKLNTMFASGVMPDLVNAPMWSVFNGEGQVIMKAAKEEQLLALDDYIDKYPNVKRLYEVGVGKAFEEYHLGHSDFGGKKYVIPQQTPGENSTDYINWAYGVYARGDILKELGVKPEEIDSSEKLYDLLTKIKNGNFKDISGKPVIPAGTWHNGWNYGDMLGSWSSYTISDYRQIGDDVVHYSFLPDEEEKLIYMRRLINEGLFDLEAFSNTDTMAKEKMAIGKIAVFGAQSGMGFFSTTLLKSNPEMKFELLGPFKNKDGEIKTQVEQTGRNGFPAMFMPASLTKQPEKIDAILRFLDFVNSDEGKLIANFGIEGIHHDIVDEKPVLKPEVLKLWQEDGRAKINAGVFALGGFIGADDRMTKYPTSEEDKSQYDKWQDEYKAKLPIKFMEESISADNVVSLWPGEKEYRDNTSTLNYEDELRKAYFAKTDEDALKILNDYRQKLKDAGIDELTTFIKEEASKNDKIGF